MEVIEITKSNYMDYDALDIVAFSRAAPGAMGDSGAIVIVTTDGCVYHLNPYFGDISMEETFRICPPVKDCQFGIFSSGKIPEGWQSYYMGCGNFLVIRNDISAQFSAINNREEKQDRIYKVKRQITYKGESEKAPLLEQLDKYNEEVLIYTDDSTEWQTIQLGRYGQITLPAYMRPVSNYQEAPSAFRTINLCTYEYGERDAYASYSVSLLPGYYPFEDMQPSDFAYFKDIDEQYKEQMEQSLSEGGIYMFKWLPYEYTKICGYQALRLRYYRHGKGNPIPVYVESYSISAPYGEVNVTFSYQSNHTNRFSKPFKESLESMILE